jgi:hypothetical protein
MILTMRRPQNSSHRLLPTLLVLVLLLLTTNAYACLIPLYDWGSAAMQACGEPQAPARDFCEPFKSLGFHAAPPKLPPLELHSHLFALPDVVVWNPSLAAPVASVVASFDHVPPDLLLLISVLRI